MFHGSLHRLLMFSPLVAAYKLGSDFDWSLSRFVRSVPVPLLQIWCSYKRKESFCTLHCMFIFFYSIVSSKFIFMMHYRTLKLLKN